jgi:hypothetical protein
MSESVTWGPPGGGDPGSGRPERTDAARNRRLLLTVAREMLTDAGAGAGAGADKLTMDALAERLAAYGRARIDFLIGHREIARAALDGREPVSAGTRTPMSQVHIRLLIGQLRLADADLDVLSTQLMGALDGPLLLYLSSAALAQNPARVSERLGRGWADLVRRVTREELGPGTPQCTLQGAPYRPPARDHPAVISPHG